SRFMNLWSSKRFREGKFGIFHHDAPNQRDEENAENTSDEDENRRLPVGVDEAEGGPRSRDQERRNSEDCAGRDALPDRSAGPRYVFLKERTLPRPHGGHADDGRGICRSHGNTSA